MSVNCRKMHEKEIEEGERRRVPPLHMAFLPAVGVGGKNVTPISQNTHKSLLLATLEVRGLRAIASPSCYVVIAQCVSSLATHLHSPLVP